MKAGNLLGVGSKPVISHSSVTLAATASARQAAALRTATLIKLQSRIRSKSWNWPTTRP